MKKKETSGNKMRKHASIKVKLMLVMTLLVAGTIFLCWFFINTCLERYYIYQKQNELISSYDAIDRAGRENALESKEFTLLFNNICSTKNIDTIIISAERQIILSYSPDDKAFRNQLVEMMWGVGAIGEKTLRSTDHYTMQEQTDATTGSECIALIGTLANDDYIYMKTPLESIRESAKSTSQFFLFVGIGATIICVVIIYFVAKSISQPIQELSSLSKRMCNLEFDAKFEPKFHSSRELETLGSNMNELSETLQQTIGELKGANNELKDDIAKKEKIDEMRKEFLSNVSHELKTPLALISGYAEGLKECINDSEESREFYCDVIMDETDKMNRMVGKLLTLNQLEFGNERVEMSCFDITELIKGVVNANTLLADTDGITISFAQDEPAHVWGDEFKVEEVITNYLSNAMHYAAGAKQVRIYYEQRKKLLRVCVYNSGSNIPEEELDKIWIKFYKVDKARTREYGGSGIGLSIVKAIMNSMHQECGVCNVEDGVVFWMELERNN